MEVFEMTVDTLIMCYISDEESNGVAKFGDPDLQQFVKEHGELKDLPSPTNSSDVAVVTK